MNLAEKRDFMAPESERATCGKLMSAWNPGAGAAHCNRESGHDGSCSHTFTYQPEPTLTCSEVVERLAKLGFETAWLAYESPRDVKWFRAEAEAILHSWRERRVQELEDALRLLVEFIEPVEGGSIFEPKRDMAHLHKLVDYARKSL
jgi:hypothetical protein